MSYRAFVTLFTLIIGVNIYASLPLHTLSYDISNNGVALGNEVRTLTKEGEIYTYTAATQTSGFVKLFFDYQLSVISSFRVTPELSPISYQIKESKDGSITQDVSLSFSNDSVKTDTKKWIPQKRALDVLSIFLALGHDYQANRALEYQVADGKKLKTQVFEVKEERDISLTINNTLENLSVIVLTNNNDIEVFLSPKYQYIPVRVIKKSWEYQLTKIDF